MATVKIVFRAAVSEGSPGALYFRVIHRRRVRLIHSGYHIFLSEWNGFKAGRAKGDCIGQRGRCPGDVEREVNVMLARIERIISVLDCRGVDYSVDEVVERFYSVGVAGGFLEFCRREIVGCREAGRVSAAEHFVSAVNSFVRFYGEGEVSFDEFDAVLVSRYESFMKQSGLCLNTISYYMRKLRVLYNRAVEKGLVEDRRPFRFVYTGVAKTVKRAIPLSAVKALKGLDLSGRPLDAFSRDVFMFSFYTRGMAPVDIAYMHKNALRNGFLCYRRRKTSQGLQIKWTAEMEAIVMRHGDAESPYMLPLIKVAGRDERRQYLSATHLINRHLKMLGREIGLTEPLTLYVARHAWASIALSNNVPIGVISQGLGHDSERTTRIYIATLDSSPVDKANEDIIGLLED